MLKKNEREIFVFELFLGYPGLLHGFSSIANGDMRSSHANSSNSLASFTQALAIDKVPLVSMNQVHGNKVQWVKSPQAGSIIHKTDGILTKEKNLFLCVYAADCVPIFLFDKQKKYIGVVHAGWRGLYREIITKAIDQMIDAGSSPTDILAGIGPCIRSCCYTIDEERAELFESKFANKFPLVYITRDDNNIYMNLPLLAQLQLQYSDLPAENIEESKICTKDSKEFYSFRREGKEFGEHVGIIGML